jgi:RNA polymerase sigma factor (sigma-70 family)
MSPAEEALDRLTPKLRSIAYRIAQGDPSGVLDPDDIFQEMAIVLLERSEKDPEFLNQKDAYILVTCAHNGGTHKVRSSRTHYHHYAYTTESTDDAFDDIIDLIPSREPSPEKQVIDLEEIRAISAAYLALTPENQQVVKLLYLGDRQTEVAAVMGITPAAISQRKQVIARTFAEYLPA